MDIPAIDSLDLTYRDNQRLAVADDCELYFESEGEGPCITFVPTIYVSSTAWRNFTRLIVAHNRLLTYDLRNQGASTGRAAGFDQHKIDLVHLLDHLEIKRTYLVGSSISTVVCRDFAASYAERVSGLIFVGPPFSPWGSQRRLRLTKSWLKALESGGPAQLFDVMYPLVFSDHAQALGGTASYLAFKERFLAINSAAQLKANLVDTLDIRPDIDVLPKITTPTLLLCGDDDFCISPTGLRVIADLMPDARVEVYEDCGHLPFFEASQRFQQSVLSFINHVEGKRLNTES